MTDKSCFLVKYIYLLVIPLVTYVCVLSLLHYSLVFGRTLIITYFAPIEIKSELLNVSCQ